MALDSRLTSEHRSTARWLRATIEHLASIERASCSVGEHRAAEWIASQLRGLGAAAEVEHHRIHGTYWWPLGLTSAGGVAAALLGRRGHRRFGVVLGALATALVFDELGAGRRWLRRVLPKQTTANVVATTGDLNAERTLVIVAHHDAAHSGIFFDPRITEFLASEVPDRPGARTDFPGPMLPIALGPALGGLSALLDSSGMAKLSTAFCAGIVFSFAHIASTHVVPGANDNLTGVATLIEVARAVAERPIEGLRLMLVSTGSEESLMEGMRSFADRHFPGLAPDRTHVLCVDAVGSPFLVLVEAEGMLEVRRYDDAFKDVIAECAADQSVKLIRGFTMRLGTDGYLALRRGIPAASLMSLNEYRTASNYHWPTDTPERVNYRTVEDAVRVCEAVVRRLAVSEAI